MGGRQGGGGHTLSHGRTSRRRRTYTVPWADVKAGEDIHCPMGGRQGGGGHTLSHGRTSRRGRAYTVPWADVKAEEDIHCPMGGRQGGGGHTLSHGRTSRRTLAAPGVQPQVVIAYHVTGLRASSSQDCAVAASARFHHAEQTRACFRQVSTQPSPAATDNGDMNVKSGILVTDLHVGGGYVTVFWHLGYSAGSPVIEQQYTGQSIAIYSFFSGER